MVNLEEEKELKVAKKVKTKERLAGGGANSGSGWGVDKRGVEEE